MIVLIAGASHTGKTLLAQKLLETCGYPYLCIDHLKMGLIRSGYTDLTPEDDSALTAYLWPILREIIKTAVENRQNLILEGCYIPFDWQKDFPPEYLRQIRYFCLVMSQDYIRDHFDEIRSRASVIENRLDDSGLSTERLLLENQRTHAMCSAYGLDVIWINGEYAPEIRL